MSEKLPVFFHPDQLQFKPLYEWAFGKRIKHPETTRRAESILAKLKKSAEFEILSPTKVPLQALRDAHNYQLLTLYNTASLLPDEETFYPRLFPKMQQSRADATNIQHAGFYCFDAGTPLNSKTWIASSWSAACAVEAAKVVLNAETPVSYSLSRPPGHHAAREYFGGYCYFNNAAIAAKRLRKKGRVVLIDIDFHHGNGTQDIFYRDDQVLFISIHGDPRDYYPFVCGFQSEHGAGAGEGFTLNFPLPKGLDYQEYQKVLRKQVLPNIRRFDPDFLVVSAGFDGYKLDPVGDWTLNTEDFRLIGEALGNLKKPTVVVQEGGYYSQDLGLNVEAFLQGVMKASFQPKSVSRATKKKSALSTPA